MAAKTAKARKLSMLEAKWVQAVGDAADYERGREVRVYDHLSTREQIDRREDFVAARRSLTPVEDWCVAMGYMKNPYVEARERAKSKPRQVPCAVYFEDGRKLMVRTLDKAREMLYNGGVSKIWNSEEKCYETRGLPAV